MQFIVNVDDENAQAEIIHEAMHPIIVRLVESNECYLLKAWLVASQVPYDDQPAYAYDLIKLDRTALQEKIKKWKKKGRSRLSDLNKQRIADWLAS